MFNIYSLYCEYGLQLSSAMFSIQDMSYIFFHHTVMTSRTGLGYALNLNDVFGIGLGSTVNAEGHLGYKIDEMA